MAHHAAKSCYSDCLHKIIDIDKSCLEVTDQHGRTPLHYASSYDRVENYNLIQLANSKLVSQSDSIGMKPIHYAAENGCIKVLSSIFTDECKSAQFTDGKNNTIAHYAAKRGHLHVLELISTHMFAMLKLLNHDNKNIADLADENNHPNLVTDILDKFIITKNLTDQPIIKGKMIKKVPEQTAKAKAKAKTKAKAKAKAKSKAKSKSKSKSKSKKDSKTFFQQLVHSIKYDTTEEFKTMYANKSICSKETDTDLNTLAHHAALNGEHSKLRYLLSQNMSLINAVNKKNETPTHIVAKRGHYYMFLLLFQTDANSITAVDIENKTPLEYMIDHPLRCKNGNITHLAADENDHLLIRKIAKIRKELLTEQNHAGLTPAHIAAKKATLVLFMNSLNVTKVYLTKLTNLGSHQPTMLHITEISTYLLK